MTTNSRNRLLQIKDVCTPDQWIWLVLSIGISVKIPYVIKDCMDHSHYRELERPDYPNPCIQDFYMVIVYASLIRLLRYSIDEFLYKYFEGKLEHKYSGEDLDKKVIKCTKGIFKAIYFSFTFLFGWFQVLNQTNFNPPLMFGSGDFMYTYGDFPYIQMPKHLKFYYMLSLSYYCEDLVIMVVRSPNSDFFEMVFHHLIAILLIFSSYMNGLWQIGSFVLVQMDIADIFVGLVRAFMDYVHISISLVFYAGIMFSWFHFRFIAFFRYCLWGSGFSGRIAVDNYTDILSVINILLLSLLALNFYWFFLLGRMGYRLATKNVKEDIQCIVNSKDLKESYDRNGGSRKK